MNVHYFSPGPARLPDPVRQQIKEELLDTFGIGVSVMEISHRSQQFESLNSETLDLAKNVFQVPDTHAVLFSVCGAQQHFSLLIQHLAAPQEEIAYTDTGIWAHLAVEEAYTSGRKVNLVYDGRPSEYKNLGVPESWSVPQSSKFLHLTVNNTVYGTEYKKIPTFADVPLVLDMTSSLGARTDIPWSSVAMVYSSAQKNFGIAGVSIIIIRKDLLEKSREITKMDKLGKAFTYHAIYDAKSALNTPPVFAIFAMNRTLKWMLSEGGISEMEKRSFEKSSLVYNEIDKGFYIGRADIKYRSRHNYVFNLPTSKLDEIFIEEAKKQNIYEIKGYKSVGGIRASMYNGVSIASAKHFADFMIEFRKKYG